MRGVSNKHCLLTFFIMTCFNMGLYVAATSFKMLRVNAMDDMGSHEGQYGFM